MPSKSSGSTDFENDRARTDQFKHELQAMRKEVQAELKRLVAEEVDRVAAQHQADLQAAIEHALRAPKQRGGASTRGAKLTTRPWVMAASGGAVVAAVAIVLFVFFPGVLRRSVPLAQAEATGSPAAATTPAKETPSPEFEYKFMSAAYTQKFAARDRRIMDLAQAVKAGAHTQPAVVDAIDRWQRSESTAPENDRVHSALVQYVLEKHFQAPLIIDGAITRSPCGGKSCQAILHAWSNLAQQRATTVPAPPSVASVAELRAFEQYLVASFTLVDAK